MTTVTELFAKFLVYILLLDEEYTAGHPEHSYEQVRHDLTALLAEQETAARQQGMTAEDYQAARFAVISWADEMLLQHTDWEGHQRWQDCPLLAAYAEAKQVGAEPGEDRQQQLSTHPGVWEVYALCLGLGYSGRRHSRLSDRLLLTNIPAKPSSQARHEQDTPLRLDDVWTFDFKLTPQPYEASQHTPRHRRRLLTFVSFLLVGLGVGLGLWRGLSDAPLPCLLPSTSGQTIAPLLAAQPCAQVSADVQGCTVTLSGRVESAEQRANVHRIVQGLDSRVHVDDALNILPRPFCEALALFEPMQTALGTGISGLVARPNKVGSPPVYVQGEDLIVEVTTPAQFESYIYVDFYDSDGRVHYLFFNPVFHRPFTPQSVHTLGYVDGRPLWGIGSPYGRGLVTVIATKTPLVFPPLEPRDDPGSAAFYLSRLRQALPQESGRAEATATFFFIETRSQ